jgi:hypothetical protein
LGHHVHRDIPFLIVFGTLMTMVGFFLASLGMKWAINYFGFNGLSDVAAFPAFGIILGTWVKLTRRNGWCSYSIPTRRWVSGLQKRDPWKIR